MIKILSIMALVFGFVVAEDVPITGTVQSKCAIITTIDGIYGNPTPSKLTTSTAGGVAPVIRYDVVLADAYKAVITTPTSFTSSPSLNDVVHWSGSVSVNEVTDAGMSAYETDKIVYNETTEFDLTIAGSTWFKAQSTAEYGYNKPFPGGVYRAYIQADCIAK